MRSLKSRFIAAYISLVLAVKAELIIRHRDIIIILLDERIMSSEMQLNSY